MTATGALVLTISSVSNCPNAKNSTDFSEYEKVWYENKYGPNTIYTMNVNPPMHGTNIIRNVNICWIAYEFTY